jgi:hypothetical protein
MISVIYRKKPNGDSGNQMLVSACIRSTLAIFYQVTFLIHSLLFLLSLFLCQSHTCQIPNCSYRSLSNPTSVIKTSLILLPKMENKKMFGGHEYIPYSSFPFPFFFFFILKQSLTDLPRLNLVSWAQAILLFSTLGSRDYSCMLPFLAP